MPAKVSVASVASVAEKRFLQHIIEDHFPGIDNAKNGLQLPAFPRPISHTKTATKYIEGVLEAIFMYKYKSLKDNKPFVRQLKALIKYTAKQADIPEVKYQINSLYLARDNHNGAIETLAKIVESACKELSRPLLIATKDKIFSKKDIALDLAWLMLKVAILDYNSRKHPDYPNLDRRFMLRVMQSIVESNFAHNVSEDKDFDRAVASAKYQGFSQDRLSLLKQVTLLLGRQKKNFSSAVRVLISDMLPHVASSAINAEKMRYNAEMMQQTISSFVSKKKPWEAIAELVSEAIDKRKNTSPAHENLIKIFTQNQNSVLQTKRQPAPANNHTAQHQPLMPAPTRHNKIPTYLDLRQQQLNDLSRTSQNPETRQVAPFNQTNNINKEETISTQKRNLFKWINKQQQHSENINSVRSK